MSDSKDKSEEIKGEVLEPLEISQSKEEVPKSSWLGGLGKLAEELKEDYKQSNLKKRVNETASQAKEFLDENGVAEKATKAYGATQDHLDTVAGTKLLRLVEERLELQAKYNDILATKLQEALNRIEALERRNDGSKQ